MICGPGAEIRPFSHLSLISYWRLPLENDIAGARWIFTLMGCFWCFSIPYNPYTNISAGLKFRMIFFGILVHPSTGVKCWRKWKSWRTNFHSHVDKSCFRLTFYKHSPVALTDIGWQLRKVKISKLWYGDQERHWNQQMFALPNQMGQEEVYCASNQVSLFPTSA